MPLHPGTLMKEIDGISIHKMEFYNEINFF